MNPSWLRKAVPLAGTAAATAVLLFILQSTFPASARANPHAVTAPAAPQINSVPLEVSFQGRVQVQGAPYNGVGYF